MWGDVLEWAKGSSSEDEAINVAKDLIHYDENKCAVILKEDHKYSVYLKINIKTDPSNT